MGIKIKIEPTDAGRALEIVRELRDMGLVQGQDFDFAYFPPQSSGSYSYEPNIPARAEFEFYNEKYSSMFALKYT